MMDEGHVLNQFLLFEEMRGVLPRKIDASINSAFREQNKIIRTGKAFASVVY